MGAHELLAAAVVALAVACSPGTHRDAPSGSLSLMNQTYDPHTLSLFRPAQVDCLGIAQNPSAGLRSTSWELERCVTLAPLEVVGLDRERPSESAHVCDAVALSGPQLEPHGVFWTDTDDASWGAEARDSRLALVSVARALVLEPAPRAVSMRLDELPASSCLGAR